MKIKTLYIFNREIWPELLPQRDELRLLASSVVDEEGKPYVDYKSCDQKLSNFSVIPFVNNTIPYEWLFQNLIPFSDGTFDQILFHIPSDQWGGGNTNGFTIEGKGRPTIICVHSHRGEQLFNNPAPEWKDRGLFERGQHEFAHGITDILHIPDVYIITDPATNQPIYKWHVHDIEEAGNLWKMAFFVYLGLTKKPNTAETVSTIQKILDSMKSLLLLKQKQLQTLTDRMNNFCLAIQAHEGYFIGSRSYRNNNPGNLRFAGQRLAIGKDPKDFAIFKTYDGGFQTLREMITRAASGQSSVYQPTMTILQFFRKYAPAADSNNPDTYAAFVASKCGLLISSQIRELVNL